MTGFNQEFVSHESIFSVAYKTAICFAGIALGMWLLASPEFWMESRNVPRVGVQITGGVIVFILGLTVAQILRSRASNRNAALRIDKTGLYAKSLSETAIPWEEIKSIQTQGAAALLQLKRQSNGTFNRERIFNTQDEIWSDMNIIRLPLMGYAHKPAEIWNDLEARFKYYKES